LGEPPENPGKDLRTSTHEEKVTDIVGGDKKNDAFKKKTAIGEDENHQAARKERSRTEGNPPNRGKGGKKGSQVTKWERGEGASNIKGIIRSESANQEKAGGLGERMTGHLSAFKKRRRSITKRWRATKKGPNSVWGAVGVKNNRRRKRATKTGGNMSVTP